MRVTLFAIIVFLAKRVNANACAQTLTEPQTLEQHVDQTWPKDTEARCQYYLEAPPQHVVNITLTRLHGFPPPQKEPAPQTNQDCLPRLDFTEVMSLGREQSILKLCERLKSSGLVVVSDTHLVKLTFDWPPGHSVGFSLNFNFVHQKAPCEFRCLDGGCLPEASLVCNSVLDCLDGSDEDTCPQADTGNSDNLLQILIIIIVLVLIVLVSVCCITQYRLPARLSEYRSRRDSQTDNNHLNPASPHPSSSEVVYVPNSPGRSERPRHRDDQQIRLPSPRQDAPPPDYNEVVAQEYRLNV